jgi:hypothetical protein
MLHTSFRILVSTVSFQIQLKSAVNKCLSEHYCRNKMTVNKRKAGFIEQKGALIVRHHEKLVRIYTIGIPQPRSLLYKGVALALQDETLEHVEFPLLVFGVSE